MHPSGRQKLLRGGARKILDHPASPRSWAVPFDRCSFPCFLFLGEYNASTFSVSKLKKDFLGLFVFLTMNDINKSQVQKDEFPERVKFSDNKRCNTVCGRWGLSGACQQGVSSYQNEDGRILLSPDWQRENLKSTVGIKLANPKTVGVY